MRSTRFITQLPAAQFAANVYGNKETVRAESNVIQIPDGWTTIKDNQLFSTTSNSSGFMARAYFKPGNFSQIVISYAGTTDESTQDSILDWVRGNAAGAGVLTEQVKEAVIFYAKLRQAYPDAQFNFTGHSLGGGLAGLMALYFDEPAFTFDPAPFLLLSLNPYAAIEIAQTLAWQGLQVPSSLALFVNPLTRAERLDNLEQVRIKGEILDLFSAGAIGTVESINLLTQAIGGFQLPLLVPGGHPVDLHSMTLLVGLLKSSEFKDAIIKDPRLLPRIFRGLGDPEGTNPILAEWANSDPKKTTSNLLDLLVQREIAGENTLAQLALDLAKLKFDDGLLKNDKLAHDYWIDTILAGLYSQANGRTPNTSGLTPVTSVISSDTSSLSADLAAMNEEQAKDIRKIWQAYIQSRFIDDYRSFSIDRNTILTTQNGPDALSLSLTGRNDVVIGFTGNDQVDGGGGLDLILGGAGADRLSGGADSDELFGESGDDTLDGGAGNFYLIESSKSIRPCKHWNAPKLKMQPHAFGLFTQPSRAHRS